MVVAGNVHLPIGDYVGDDRLRPDEYEIVTTDQAGVESFGHIAVRAQWGSKRNSRDETTEARA